MADGRVSVGDRENNRVQVFDAAGDYEGEWRGVYKPMDIYVAANELTYASDQLLRVVAFDGDGNIIGSGRPVETLPHGVRGDRAGNIHFTELPLNRISKLTPLS